MIGFSDEMLVRDQVYSSRTKPLLIAEIGTNHNQSFLTARSLIDLAAKAGFDAVKFQIYEAHELTWRGYFGEKEAYPYRDQHVKYSPDFDSLKTPKEWFPKLKNVGHELGLAVGVTVHGEEGIAWAEAQDFDFFKVASMDHNNWPLLSRLRDIPRKPILVSAGMAGLGDVSTLINTFEGRDGGFALLHCVSVYPHEFETSRVSAIKWYKDHFGCVVGFSDHTDGIVAGVAASILGATIFERHITTHRDQPGPDHSFADDAADATRYCQAVRWAFALTAKAELEPLTVAEEEAAREYLRGVYATRNLEVGESLQLTDVVCVRPPSHLTPNDLPFLLGRPLKKSVSASEPIRSDYF